MCRQILNFIVGSFRMIMFLCTFLLMLAGLLLTASGYVGRDTYRTLNEDDYELKSFFILLGGLYVIILAFAGACGAFYNQKGIIRGFAILNLINILIVAITLATMRAPDIVQNEEILLEAQKKYNWSDTFKTPPTSVPQSVSNRTRRESGSSSTNDSINKYNDQKNATELWDRLQCHYKCCGVKHPSDWEALAGKGLYPKSCCEQKDTTTRDGKQYCTQLYRNTTTGCFLELGTAGTLSMSALIFVATVSLLLSIVSIIASVNSQYHGVSATDSSNY